MKLFEFVGAETDWIAANSPEEAREALKVHYGITDRDVDGSYEEINEVDPEAVEFYVDETPISDEDEEDETPMRTAAEMMKGKTKPFLVGSTCQ